MSDDEQHDWTLGMACLRCGSGPSADEDCPAAGSIRIQPEALRAAIEACFQSHLSGSDLATDVLAWLAKHQR